MPDTAEILLPPFTRAFADNIRVENLTFQGAAEMFWELFIRPLQS